MNDQSIDFRSNGEIIKVSPGDQIRDDDIWFIANIYTNAGLGSILCWSQRHNRYAIAGISYDNKQKVWYFLDYDYQIISLSQI